MSADGDAPSVLPAFSRTRLELKQVQQAQQMEADKVLLVEPGWN